MFFLINNPLLSFSLSNVYICGFSNIEKVDDENKWDKPISYFMVPEIKAFQTSDETTYNPFKAEIFVFGKLLSEILGSTQQESKFKKVIDHCTEEKPEERPTTKDIKTLYFK